MGTGVAIKGPTEWTFLFVRETWGPRPNETLFAANRPSWFAIQHKEQKMGLVTGRHFISSCQRRKDRTPLEGGDRGGTGEGAANIRSWSMLLNISPSPSPVPCQRCTKRTIRFWREPGAFIGELNGVLGRITPCVAVLGRLLLKLTGSLRTALHQTSVLGSSWLPLLRLCKMNVTETLHFWGRRLVGFCQLLSMMMMIIDMLCL